MGGVVIIDKADLLRAGKINPANLIRLARSLKSAPIEDPEAEYAKLPEHVRECVSFVQWLANELEERIIPPKRGGWY